MHPFSRRFSCSSLQGHSACNAWLRKVLGKVLREICAKQTDWVNCEITALLSIMVKDGASNSYTFDFSPSFRIFIMEWNREGYAQIGR